MVERRREDYVQRRRSVALDVIRGVRSPRNLGGSIHVNETPGEKALDVGERRGSSVGSVRAAGLGHSFVPTGCWDAGVWDVGRFPSGDILGTGRHGRLTHAPMLL